MKKSKCEVKQLVALYSPTLIESLQLWTCRSALLEAQKPQLSIGSIKPLVSLLRPHRLLCHPFRPHCPRLTFRHHLHRHQRNHLVVCTY